jgi:hypothetical protein
LAQHNSDLKMGKMVFEFRIDLYWRMTNKVLNLYFMYWSSLRTTNTGLNKFSVVENTDRGK